MATAQTVPADTSDALQEVLVVGQGEAVPVSTVQRIPAAAVAQTDAASVAQLARLVPGASVTTNSRGETLVYLRASGERQLAVFLDCAPLNVPWDNRLDLGIVPAGIVQGLTVSKGPAALEYGANVSGGVVNLTTFAPQHRHIELGGTVGTEAYAKATAAYGQRFGRLAFTAAAGFVRTDGQSLAQGADAPYSQAADDLRTNTDLRLANVYLRGVFDATARTRFGLTLLHADAEKGVAPESQLDPASASPRYWRYPQMRTTMAILSGETTLGTADVRGAAWLQRFGQHVEQYANAAYEMANTLQEDDDRTVGARLTLRQPFGTGAIRIVGSAMQSDHDQRDRPVASGTPGDAPLMAYQQRTATVGATAEYAFSNRLRGEVGAGYDAVDFPETADKPARDAFAAPSFNAGLRFDAAPGGETWHIRASAGRKTRFPTMRELFGEALRRFLVNPDLTPEASWLVEAGAGWTGARWSAEIVPFATFTDGTIDQENVTVSGQRLRRRINLKGSRVLGVELNAAALLSPALTATAHLTAMDIRWLKDTDASPAHLTERPGAGGRFGLSYDAGQGPTGLVEAVYTGRAYSLGTGSDLVALPRATVLNLRAGYRLPVPTHPEVFARVDNVFDAVTVPQLGLPGPGRTAQLGARLAF